MNEPLAGRQIRVGDDETARLDVDTERSNGASVAAGQLDRDIAPCRDLARGPAGAIELPSAELLDFRLDAREECLQEQRGADCSPTRELVKARHPRLELSRKGTPMPAGVEAKPDHDARIGRTEAIGLAEDAGELAQRPGAGIGRTAVD